MLDRNSDILTFSGGDHLLRRCCYREWRDWANLPSELTEQIASRLLEHDVSEYLRFRAVCKPWRQCTADPRGSLESRFRPRRWIMLSSCDGFRRCFLNLATGACAHVDLPELCDHRVEASTEGFLVLRNKVSDAVCLLNPLAAHHINLPPITKELRSVSPGWHEGRGPSPSHIAFAGISDETSPPSVALFLIGQLLNVAYAKPGDKRWSLMDQKSWRIIPDDLRVLSDRARDVLMNLLYMSVITLRGRIYVATYQGHILKVSLHPRPRFVLVVTDHQSAGVLHCNVVSYLVPADDNGRGMLMVRYYDKLTHLTPDQLRRIKRRKKTNLIKLPGDRTGWYNWHLLEVFKVDLRRKKLVPTESIGQGAVFIGDVAPVSLSSRMFPSLYGDAVYIGVNSLCSMRCGLRHLKDNSIEPRLELVVEGGGHVPFGFCNSLSKLERIVPHARPCSLEEYLVCYVGVRSGIKD